MNSSTTSTRFAHWSWTLGEIGLIFLLFFIYAGWPAPDVNEAHYLAKAKHYWDPAWCAGDAFLESADAHLVFYWTIGWLTRLLPLPAVAWFGRFLTWVLLAWAWYRLSTAVAPRRLLAVLSAAVFLLFNQRCQMAGEWVVGGLEAKGFAYVLVFLALESMLRQRWRRAWVYLGAATAFHVLVGGWSLIAGGCAWLSCRHLRPTLRVMAPGLLAALLLTLPGLLPALTLRHGVGPEVETDANLIYVYGRLPHHLAFHTFPRAAMMSQALLLVVWLAASCATPCRLPYGELGQRPLRGFVGGAVTITICGIAIDQLLLQHVELAAALLRFYWYRLCDAMLPVGAALALAGYVERLRIRRPLAARWALAIGVAVAGSNLASGNLQRRRDLRPNADRQSLPDWPDDPDQARRTYDDWYCTCRWIAEHTEPDARCLTPRWQSTFKWYAGRSEVCCWKDLPQDAAAIVAWWQRVHEVYPPIVSAGGVAAHGQQQLAALAAKYDVQYIVVDRYLGRQPLLMRRVYPGTLDEPNASYEVYRVAPPKQPR